jgi:hypothetical protein
LGASGAIQIDRLHTLRRGIMTKTGMALKIIFLQDVSGGRHLGTLWSCHSARSACTGSTMAALRAGMYVAIQAIATIESVAAIYVQGSIGLT